MLRVESTDNNSMGNNNSGVGDDVLLETNLGLDLGADLGDDVGALLGEGGLGDGLDLVGALLGLSALLLGGALLLGHGVGHILALLLSGALKLAQVTTQLQD